MRVKPPGAVRRLLSLLRAFAARVARARTAPRRGAADVAAMLLEVATMRASRTSAQLPAALRGALREPKATLAAARARARAVVRLRLGALLWVWDGAVRAALLGACTLAESAPAQRVSRAATRAVARAVALAARERSPLPALGALGGQAPRNADLAHNQAPLTAVLAPRARPPAPAARLDCAGARARAMDALPAAPLPLSLIHI